MERQNTQTIYEATASDMENSEIIDTQLTENFIVSPGDLEQMWTFFRTRDSESIALHGLPVNNKGKVLKQTVDLSAEQAVYYDIAKEWFLTFVRDDEIRILQIDAPGDSALFRKTGTGEKIHKFVTMGMPANPLLQITICTFLAVRAFSVRT